MKFQIKIAIGTNDDNRYRRLWFGILCFSKLGLMLRSPLNVC